MKKSTRLASFVLAIFFLVLSLPNFLHAQDRNVAKRIKVVAPGAAVNGDTLAFLQYKPVTYSSGNNRKYPVIIFLHGGAAAMSDDVSIEPGADVWDRRAWGPSRLVARGEHMAYTWNNVTDTFEVLSPLLRKTKRAGPQAGQPVYVWPNEYILAMLQYAKDSLKADTNRIFLTGMSLGGGGVFRFLATNSAHAKKLAAAAPVCARQDHFFQSGSNGAKYIGEAKLPVWAFHAADDNVNPADEGTEMPIDAINNHSPAPRVKALKTIWPNGPSGNPHSTWTWVYNTDTYTYGYDGIINIYEWFLGQNKSALPNTLPTADAGLDITIPLSQGTADLNGSNSKDETGGVIRRFVWKKLFAPAGSSPTIANSLSPNSTTTVSNLNVAGDYIFRLYVVDNRGAIATDDVTITVSSTPGTPPSANAGSDQTITLPQDSIRIFGSGTPGGSIVGYSWLTISGPGNPRITPNASAQNPYMKDLEEGEYYFRLKVTDNNNQVGYDTVKVTVNPDVSNPAPFANAGNDQSITLPVDSIRLYGNGTDQPGGSIVGYFWEYIDGGPGSPWIYPNPIARNPIMKNLEEGVYRFRLKVTDNEGATSDFDTVSVTVNENPTNPPPVANAGADQTIALPLDSIRVYGNWTDDGTIVSYLWEYVSGPSSYEIFPNENAKNPIFKQLTPGTYQFRFTVTDDKGASDDDIVQIIVTGNIPPLAGAGPDKTITLPVDSIRVYGSRSDPDGPTPSFYWEKVSGPSGSSIFPNPLAINPIFKNLTAGVYYFRIVVTDEDNATTADTVKITVNSGGGAMLDELTVEDGQSSKLKVSVYPNPVRDMLNVTLNSSETGRTTIAIYDAKGSVRKSEFTQKQARLFNRQVNITNLASGVYYVQVIVNGKRHTVKFIRQ